MFLLNRLDDNGLCEPVRKNRGGFFSVFWNGILTSIFGIIAITTFLNPLKRSLKTIQNTQNSNHPVRAQKFKFTIMDFSGLLFLVYQFLA